MWLNNFLQYSIFYSVILIFILSFRRTKGPIEYLGVDTSNELKGIAISMVLIGHFGIVFNTIKLPTKDYFAAHGVDLFLFLSAFGLLTSFKKNGLAGFWKRRFIVLLIPYLIFNIVRVPILIIHGQNMTLDTILLSLIGINVEFDPSMWYIQYIVIWYLVFFGFASIKSLSSRGLVTAFSMFGLLLFLLDMYLTVKFDHLKNPLTESYSHHLGFPLGAIFFLYYDYIKSLSNKTMLIISSIMLVCYVSACSYIPDIIPYTLANLTYVLFIVFLFIPLTNLGFKSNLLIAIGKISYHIYLNEFFVMIVFITWFGLTGNTAAIAVLVASIIIGYMIKLPSDMIVKKLK